MKIAILPAVLTDALARTRTNKKRFDRGRSLHGVPKGERQTTLFKFASSERGRGASFEEAIERVLAVAAKCQPPVPEREARKIVTDVYDRYPAGPQHPYLIIDSSTFREYPPKNREDEPRRVRLANFTAEILSDRSLDDGSGEVVREFEIEVCQNGKTQRATVPAREFGEMKWVIMRFGAKPIVEDGKHGQMREAIQHLSTGTEEKTIFTHTGWQKVNGIWRYLHAGLTDVSVQLPPSLAQFVLPAPPTDAPLDDAIRASLELLSVAPDRITFPLLAAVYRAPLGTADFSLGVVGPTGVFKTACAALAMQHYGAGFDAQHLPGSWSSTSNFLELLAFVAKDALVVIDDFKPGGTPVDRARTYREADRLLRAQANGSGRGRLSADANPKPAKPPRGLILFTGEEPPLGESLKGRIFLIEIGPAEVDRGRLTAAQAHAASGLYAGAMAGYVDWLAPRLDEVHAELPEIRRRASCEVFAHARTAWQVADLYLGVCAFSRFARESGVLTESERGALCDRAWEALIAAGRAQAEAQTEADPLAIFLELLRAALASGEAHLADMWGNAPTGAAMELGWRRSEKGDLMASGVRVGSVDGTNGDVFLIPAAAYKAAQRMAADGNGISITSRTLSKRLREAGKLVTTGGKERKKITTRRRLGGLGRTEVLHLKIVTIFGEELAQAVKKEPF